MTASNAAKVQSGRRQLTGRMVLFCLLAFFGIVAAVNAVMIRFATTTFAGLETSSAYAAGLSFKRDEAAAEQQDALGWKVDGRIMPAGEGRAKLIVTAHTQDGMSIPGWTAKARLAHPANARLDHVVELTRTGTDQASGDIVASAGQWDLLLELSQDNGQTFRSRSRITLR